MYSVALPKCEMGNSKIHQLRKNRQNPTARIVQILLQLIFSAFTPLVPKHESSKSKNFNPIEFEGFRKMTKLMFNSLYLLFFCPIFQIMY